MVVMPTTLDDAGFHPGEPPYNVMKRLLFDHHPINCEACAAKDRSYEEEFNEQEQKLKDGQLENRNSKYSELRKQIEDEFRALKNDQKKHHDEEMTALSSIRADIQDLKEDLRGVFDLMLTLNSGEFPRWLLVLPYQESRDSSNEEGKEGKEGDEEVRSGLSKWNSRINAFFDWKDEKERSILRKIGVYQYWKVVVIDEGPMLPGLPEDWQPPDNAEASPFWHEGIEIQTPGKLLQQMAPTLKLFSSLLKLASSGMSVAGFPMIAKLPGVKDFVESKAMAHLDKLYNTVWEEGGSEEENKAMGDFLADVTEAVANEGEDDSGNQFHKAFSTLKEDPAAIEKVFKASSEAVLGVMNDQCENWKDQLNEAGLHRVYHTKSGKHYWVSEVYQSWCEDEDMYSLSKVDD